MKRATTLVLALACFLTGALVQRLYDSRRSAAPLTSAQAVQAAKPPVAPEPPAVAEVPAPDLSAVKFDHEPLWAYGFTTVRKPDEKAPPPAPPSTAPRPAPTEEQKRPRHVDGSTASYSILDVRDAKNVIDWFPSDHPAMPDVVKHGPARLGETTRGCASCHLPTGKGRPENASVVGLPITYFLRQIQDFRSGLRRSADPRKPNTNLMIDLAKGMTDDELEAAAEYFGSGKFSPWVHVVETTHVPKTRINGNLFLATEEAKSEPIAGRIIEVPENEEQAESYRNPRSGFVAYVPVGSIKKGKDLVTTGGMRIVGDKIVQGKTTACGTCHGIDLMGVADIPPIAGRSPSYIARQIWDIQQGTRRGASAQLMRMAVANLNEDDLVAIAAYVASLAPVSAPAAQATQAATTN